MTRFALRVPTDLYAQLRNRAVREHRSVNNLIVHLLAEATKGDWIVEDHEQEEIIR